ncbi:ankyrin repeat domain-containing protein [Acidovorax sp. M2(2025)]|uniref:ankyrin repeat domain-containing protein n=1 Tax=Acidovorax sp. M2(2025) TaxID=3411355 RepID=UPI003BF61CC8
MAFWAGRAGALLFSAVFAIAFGLGGYFAGLQPLGHTLLAAWQVRSWQPVPGQVLDTELLRHSGSKGGSTYDVRAHYRYEFGGRALEGRRVGLERVGGADNIGDWHQQWHRRLQQAREQGQSVTVWVNPADPADALLDPAIRWSLLAFRLPFAFVFTGVGVGAAVLFGRLLLQRQRPNGAEEPASVPAQAAGATVRSSLQGSAAGIWIFTLFWCGIAFPMAAMLWADRGASGWAKAFISVFVAIGVVLLGFAVGQTRKVWRYRGSAFTVLPQRPLGGSPVEATVLLPEKAGAAAQPLRLRLAQYRVDESSSGSPERRVEAVDARTTQQPTPDGGARLVARFSVPADAPSHGAKRSGERVDWRVELLREDGSVELFYEVPVQAAPSAALGAAEDRFDRRAAWTREERIALSQDSGLDAPEAPWPAGVTVSEDAQGWQLAFSQRAWQWAAGIALCLLVLEWVVNDRLGAHGLLPPRSLGGLLVATVLPAFALHAATRHWALRVQDSGIVVQRTSWLWTSVRSVPGDASQALVHKLLYSTGSGAHEHPYHAVYARGAHGARVRLTPGLAGADAAVAVGHAVAQAWRDRRGRFAAGELRAGRDHSRPGWGWLVVAALLAALWWAPQRDIRASAGATAPGGTPESSRWSAVDRRLMDAQDAGDAAALEAALRDGANPNLLADSGSSVLMLVAHRGQLAHVELLLRAGAQPDMRQTRKDSERGDTALLRAFYGGHLAVAQRLAQAGASLQARNRWDWGPVHMAAQSGCVACLQWLADQGQSLEEPAPASLGETPAMLAAAKGQLQALQWMQARGVDLGRRDRRGKNAVDWARWGHQADAERWLMERL